MAVAISGRRAAWAIALLAWAFGAAVTERARAQEALIERPGPPEIDDLETDANHDGVPDGWYNARGATIHVKGGAIGPRFVRFEGTQRGRSSRLSRAFGLDGRKTEAVLLGLWLRADQIAHGERDGSEPGLVIDFYGENLHMLAHASMGPWARPMGPGWTRVVKRLPVAPGVRDAILTVGLMGATGTLDMDGMTVELVPVGGIESTNLLLNGGFELGDPAPAYWGVEKDAHRTFPGHQSSAALQLVHAGAQATAGLGVPIGRFESLEVSLFARGSGLRGSGGAAARIFFLDDYGRQVEGAAQGRPLLRWSGTFPWKLDQTEVAVPRGATRAVFQIEKLDGVGTLRIDDVRVLGQTAPDAAPGAWLPFHESDETEGWLPVAPSPRIVPESALDVSFLVEEASGHGSFVTVKDGHLVHQKGERARFLGVGLVPPTAFQEPEAANALADRLVRSGTNLVRLEKLDTALGPERSLFDDSRDDTRHLDPVALARLDHLIAALKSRGASVALELQGARLFRTGDGVADPGLLPPGGGPAAFVDPALGELSLASAHALLEHRNSETGLALRDDPALAWITLFGGQSLFNLIDDPHALPASYSGALRALTAKAPGGARGRRLWKWAEARRCGEMAQSLRASNVRVPIAGVSHRRREPEFVEAQSGPGLDLIDDRIYWFAHQPWIAPELRSMLFSPRGGLLELADAKRREGKPYVLGQWCDQSLGAWSLPTESADFLLGVETAVAEDWDGLVRRGVFLFPQPWGAGPAGTAGGEDVFSIAQVLNASPHIDALLPHAASLFYRGRAASEAAERDRARDGAPAPARRSSKHAAHGSRHALAGWEPARGRLVIDTPFTQALAGWPGDRPARLADIEFSTENRFAVLAATSIGPEPISRTKRLLITAVGRVAPTGFAWVNSWRLAVASPGGPPFLQEPVRARVVWRRPGKLRAFALDNTGKRVGSVALEPLPDGPGSVLTLDGRAAGFHWELVAE